MSGSSEKSSKSESPEMGFKVSMEEFNRRWERRGALEKRLDRLSDEANGFCYKAVDVAKKFGVEKEIDGLTHYQYRNGELRIDYQETYPETIIVTYGKAQVLRRKATYVVAYRPDIIGWCDLLNELYEKIEENLNKQDNSELREREGADKLFENWGIKIDPAEDFIPYNAFPLGILETVPLKREPHKPTAPTPLKWNLNSRS